MYAKLPKKLFPALFLILAFSLGILTAHFSASFHSEDDRFQAFTQKLFQEEIQSNTISLHYTLANPASHGIHNYPITFGDISADSAKESASQIASLQKKLSAFNYDNLSSENQLTYDILKLFLNTEAALSSQPLLHEPLSPTLGIQAQLPVLLAEYTFRTRKDIEDYLTLLKKVPDYFKEILKFEQEKSAAGLFMSDTTAQRIIDQCDTFTEVPEENYLISVFNDKVAKCDFISQKKCSKYQQQNKSLILQSLIPAYQTLSNGLTALKGTGVNPYGLCYYPGGTEYYLTLIKASTGIYETIETMTSQLYDQMHSDFLQIQRLLTVDPGLPSKCQDEITALQIESNPENILSHLQNQMELDFPALSDSSYSVKYVHKDLEEYLSPAFYLTPPIDTLTPNSIYLNNHNELKGLSLYSTLAHEGFPGHMYQTLYYSQTTPDPVRYLFSSGGFIEGWATYIENYAYQYAPVDYETGQYMALNRSFYLCLYSLLDIYIHYYGWTQEDASEYLKVLGITDAASQNEIYQILIEDPANYLKYCLGSLSIQDLRADAQQRLGNNFDLQSFHKALLEIGPAPFPVIKQYFIEKMS